MKNTNEMHISGSDPEARLRDAFVLFDEDRKGYLSEE